MLLSHKRLMNLLNSKIIIEVIERRRPAKRKSRNLLEHQKKKERGKSKENGNNQITQAHRERNKH